MYIVWLEDIRGGGGYEVFGVLAHDDEVDGDGGALGRFDGTDVGV